MTVQPTDYYLIYGIEGLWRYNLLTTTLFMELKGYDGITYWLLPNLWHLIAMTV